jgi:exopolysaccharide biosynthesis polyprenyl glycosylphosphotransferase
MAIDILCMAGAVYLACKIRPSTLFFPITLYHVFFDVDSPTRSLLLMWIPINIFINNNNDLYETKREKLESIEIFQVIRAVATSALLTIVLIYVVKIEGFPRGILFISTVLIAVFFSVWRVLKRSFVESLVAHGFNNFNALIIGAGKVGLMLGQELRKRKTLGIKVRGYLDDFKMPNDVHANVKILGKVSDFSSVAKKEFIHQVYVTIHNDSMFFSKILEEARDLGIAVRVVPQGFELMQSEFNKYNIGIIPVLEYCDVRNLHRHQGKRLFDIVIGMLLLIATSPLFVILAVLVKLDSPGSVFYFSRRYGRRGELFNMYKFRSMVENADDLIKDLKKHNEVGGPIFKMKRDPRVTRTGAFLRKYSLDELPQILNVIRGDMSLVGPRPLPIEQVEREDFRQLKRLDVRPGITGLWQIRGRSDVSFQRLVRWDIWYINNWSFWLDLHILWQTIPVVLKGRGAY